MSKPGKEQEEKEAALLSKLKEINDHLVSAQAAAWNDLHGLLAVEASIPQSLKRHAYKLVVGFDFVALLQTSSGPLFGGNDVNGLDMLLGPQLKHTVIATKTIKVLPGPASCCNMPVEA